MRALRRGDSRSAVTLEAAAEHYACNRVVVCFLVPVVAVVLLVTIRVVA